MGTGHSWLLAWPLAWARGRGLGSAVLSSVNPSVLNWSPAGGQTVPGPANPRTRGFGGNWGWGPQGMCLCPG